MAQGSLHRGARVRTRMDAGYFLQDNLFKGNNVQDTAYKAGEQAKRWATLYVRMLTSYPPFQPPPPSFSDGRRGGVGREINTGAPWTRAATDSPFFTPFLNPSSKVRVRVRRKTKRGPRV